MANDRYMKLNGDPVHEPLWKTFHLSASAQAGGLLTAFTAATNYSNPKQALGYLAVGIGAMAALNLFVRPLNSFSLRLSFRDPDSKLCIDTKPDEKTPPTKPDHMRASQEEVSATMRKMLWVGLTSAINIPGYAAIAENIMTGSDLNASAMFAPVWSLSWLAYELSVLNRFNRVVKENWVITDTPKKVEVKQEERVPLGLTPQPQAN